MWRHRSRLAWGTPLPGALLERRCRNFPPPSGGGEEGGNPGPPSQPPPLGGGVQCFCKEAFMQNLPLEAKPSPARGKEQCGTQSAAPLHHPLSDHLLYAFYRPSPRRSVLAYAYVCELEGSPWGHCYLPLSLLGSMVRAGWGHNLLLMRYTCLACDNYKKQF